MTLFAGAIVRREEGFIPGRLVRTLRKELDRSGTCAGFEFERDGSLLLKVEIGAFGEPGYHEDAEGAVSLICGEPLLGRNGESSSRVGRDRDLARLHRGWRSGDFQLLRSADGVFSAAHLAADGSRVILATDHLGIRPVYVWGGEHLVAFSSTLRVLAALPGIRRTLDVQGVLEFATLRFPLGGRTPYREIVRLKPGEILEIPRSGRVRSSRYWRWEEEIPPFGDLSPPHDDEVYRRFRRAVRRRLGTDSATLAFLSGGLDSRCVVSVLADLGAEIHTFNFSLPETQDDLFAREFAAAVGTRHARRSRTKPVSLWEADWSFMLREAWDASPHRNASGVSRPEVAWSGDGGGVTTGGVYLTDPLVEHLKVRDFEKVAERYSSDLPERVLPPRRRGVLEELLPSGVRDELEGISHADPLRRFHLFLLFNDQSRHLDGHFEEIDRHQVELHLPFFDRTYLEAVFRVPLSRLRKHRFYHEWLECFPDVARSVPWQTYPGHLPCPVPHDTTPPDQWQRQKSRAASRERRNGRRVRRARLGRMIFSSAFPSGLLDRKRLLIAGAMDQIGLRDYRYVVNFAYDIYRHARMVS